MNFLLQNSKLSRAQVFETMFFLDDLVYGRKISSRKHVSNKGRRCDFVVFTFSKFAGEGFQPFRVPNSSNLPALKVRITRCGRFFRVKTPAPLNSAPNLSGLPSQGVANSMYNALIALNIHMLSGLLLSLYTRIILNMS